MSAIPKTLASNIQTVLDTLKPEMSLIKNEKKREQLSNLASKIQGQCQGLLTFLNSMAQKSMTPAKELELQIKKGNLNQSLEFYCTLVNKEFASIDGKPDSRATKMLPKITQI